MMAFANALLRSPSRWFVLARMALVCAAPVFLFFYHDPNRHFLWVTDWDVRIIYEAMLINGGVANFELVHVGYGLFFLLAKFLQLLKLLGAVDVIAIQDLPPAPASGAVFQELIFWARLLALIIAAGLPVSIMFIAEALTGSRYFAFLAALAFSGTRSVNTHVMQIRAEAPSALFAFLAVLFILLAMKRERQRLASLFFLSLGAFCALVAMYSKTAAIPILLLAPLLPVLFRREPALAGSGRHKPLSANMLISLTGLGLAAGFFGLWPLLAAMKPFAFVYNGMIVIFIAVCMAVYGRMLKLSPLDVAAGFAAVVFGLGAAQYLLLGFDPFSQSAPIANHVEYLSGTAITASGREGLGGMTLIAGVMGKLAANTGKVMTKSFFNFCWVCKRPSIVYLSSLFCLAVVWWKYRDDLLTCRNALFFILALVFIESVMWFHYFNHYYRMYVEGLLLAVMAYLLTRISLRSSLAARKALALFSLVFAIWFWIDDVNRKMLWPTFAARVGPPHPQVDRMPLIADRFASHMEIAMDIAGKMKRGELPEGSVPPWWEDKRIFLGAGKPWRRWDDKRRQEDK